MQNNRVIDSWEKIYSEGGQSNKYPFTDLVSLVHRHLALIPQSAKVLELGCGFGPNAQIFHNLGFAYYGIEGSATACKQACLAAPYALVLQADFTAPLPFANQSIDLLIDRSAVTHNKDSIISIIREIHRILKPRGIFIGTDFFSKLHHLAADASNVNVTERFNHMLFCDESDLMSYFNQFKVLYLARKATQRLDVESKASEYYDIVVQKA